MKPNERVGDDDLDSLQRDGCPCRTYRSIRELIERRKAAQYVQHLWWCDKELEVGEACSCGFNDLPEWIREGQ